MSVASFLKKQVVPRAYTVNDESKYLIVRNIPALKCIGELVKLFEQHGPIEEHRVLDMEEREPFTEVCWIKFVHISNARFAKRKLDDFKFYGNLLQVTYAPEYESVSDTLQKLEARRSTVLKILNPSKQKRLHTDTTNVPTEAFVTYPVIQQHEELEATKHDLSTASHCPDEPKINEMSPKQECFSSPSMNATVQSVRKRLDKISSVAVHLLSSDTQKCGKDDISQIQCSSASKRPRHDNRRRI